MSVRLEGESFTDGTGISFLVRNFACLLFRDDVFARTLRRDEERAARGVLDEGAINLILVHINVIMTVCETHY